MPKDFPIPVIDRIGRLSPGQRRLLELQLKRAGMRSPSEWTIARQEQRSQRILSYAQERLWFLDQLVPDNPFYNLAMATLIKGGVDLRVLEECVNELVRRHESMRTTFQVVEGRPVQVISAGVAASDRGGGFAGVGGERAR